LIFLSFPFFFFFSFSGDSRLILPLLDGEEIKDDTFELTEGAGSLIFFSGPPSFFFGSSGRTGRVLPILHRHRVGMRLSLGAGFGVSREAE